MYSQSERNKLIEYVIYWSIHVSTRRRTDTRTTRKRHQCLDDLRTWTLLNRRTIKVCAWTLAGEHVNTAYTHTYLAYQYNKNGYLTWSRASLSSADCCVPASTRSRLESCILKSFIYRPVLNMMSKLSILWTSKLYWIHTAVQMYMFIIETCSSTPSRFNSNKPFYERNIKSDLHVCHQVYLLNIWLYLCSLNLLRKTLN